MIRLYIDPGTGSMLFSVLIGAAAALYFFGRTLFFRIKALAGGKGLARSTPGGRIPLVIYSEGSRYWNVWKHITDECERREIPLRFFTSSANDPVFDEPYRFVAAEYIGEGNRAYARLNFLNAAVVLLTTPGLDVYQLKRSKAVGHYSHVLHSTGDPATYRLFSLDYFDSVLLTGSYQEAQIRELEQLRGLKAKELFVAGCSYLDLYAEKIKTLEQKITGDDKTATAPAETSGKKPAAAETSGGNEKKITVLVSPSWGASGLLIRYGEKLLDPLSATGLRIIVRPHPQSAISEKAVLDRLTGRYRDTPNLEWDFERENIPSLLRADIMISDFSGIIFDYIFLRDKPVIYAASTMDKRPYDASDLDHELWQFDALRETGVELREEDFPAIGDVVDRALRSAVLKEARQKAKDAAWQYRGEAGKRIAGFLVEKMRGDGNVRG